MKPKIRLSRFNQNFHLDFLKFQGKSYNSVKVNQQKKYECRNSIQSNVSSKQSLFIDQKSSGRSNISIQDFIKQQDQDTLLNNQSQISEQKESNQEQLKKVKESMFALSTLYQKTKKQKLKFVTINFLTYFFRVLGKTDLIEKILSSYIPQDILISQFLGILHNFQTKKFEKGNTIMINKEQEYFYILIQGAAEKIFIKQSIRESRKSLNYQNFSQLTLLRRSKVKYKTVTEKGKLKCFENHLPILINEQNCNICSLKTLGLCEFVILEKHVWNKLLLTLSKLQEKYLLQYIKVCTNINLNICGIKQNNKKENELNDRKKFLQDKKQLVIMNNDAQEIPNGFNSNLFPNLTNLTYEIIEYVKDEKIVINNLDIFLLVKGNIFLNTQFYALEISEGSIINSSILLKLKQSSIKIKALTSCIVIKIILENVLFRKQDENEFIIKIEEIEKCRKKVYGEHKLNSIPDVQKFLQTYQDQNTNLWNGGKDQKRESMFSPQKIGAKQLNIKKKDHLIKQNFRQRRNKNVKTEESVNRNTNYSSMNKVAINYANNYCLFDKIVESEEKVIQIINSNRVSKMIPIEKVDNYQDKVDIQISRQNLSRIFSFIKDQKKLQKNVLDEVSQNSSKPLGIKSGLQELRQRITQKSQASKQKKQRGKLIANLFEINAGQPRVVQEQSETRLRPLCYEFQREKIQKIVNRNSQAKLKNLQKQSQFMLLHGNENDDLIRQLPRTSRYCRQLIVTEPNALQSFSYGENCSFDKQNIQGKYEFEEHFIKNKKNQTKRIIRSMLTGRIRENKRKK